MDTGRSIKRVPLVEWFTTGPEGTHLIANRCRACGDYFFPKATRCRNPKCMKEELEELQISHTGKLWSYTVNYYPPPAPYVSPDPFVPYGLAVVELETEKIMIMGQVTSHCDLQRLEIGMEMELIAESLYADDQGTEVLIWKWRPATA